LTKDEDFWIQNTAIGKDDVDRETWPDPTCMVDSECDEDLEVR